MGYNVVSTISPSIISFGCCGKCIPVKDDILYSNVDTLLNKKHELQILLNSFKTKPQILALTEVNYKNKDISCEIHELKHSWIYFAP